jgi:hypothetical protein
VRTAVDIGRPRSYHPAMPMWRCPHCATPQPEAARCWVCHRSSICCATCRHYRRSVAAQLGYCGLDRRRAPLDGGEIRACWDAATIAPDTAGGVDGSDRTEPVERTSVRPGRDFVPLDDVGRVDPIVGGTNRQAPIVVTTAPATRDATGWTLFPELEG